MHLIEKFLHVDKNVDEIKNKGKKNAVDVTTKSLTFWNNKIFSADSLIKKIKGKGKNLKLTVDTNARRRIWTTYYVWRMKIKQGTSKHIIHGGGHFNI
mgnify:CR=1 FL=1